MILSIDAENAFDKSPRAVDLEGTDVSVIKAILDKPIASVVLNDGSNVGHQDLNTKALHHFSWTQ